VAIGAQDIGQDEGVARVTLGGDGAIQFQCVVPLEQSRTGIRALLSATAAAGQRSLLAVLKRLGHQDGLFSFPMEGYTLALDFPATEQALALVERLDRIVLDHDGRLYLAKDARMTRATFEASGPRVADFRSLRAKIGASERFVSAQSARLAL
jgi:decaprenylphospho-beta-D-ribofuranose 2-oxidase